MKKILFFSLSVIVCLLSLSACTKTQTPQKANELQFSLDGITALTISYDEETITFFESDDDSLIVREYMTENKKSYYAKVSEKTDSIQISEGGKPRDKDGFSRYVEIYLPASYSESLTITSTNGHIDLSNADLNVTLLRVDNTSGTITVANAAASEIHLSSTSGIMDLGSVQADHIRLDTTSAAIRCTELNGAVTYTSTSGDLNVKSAAGSGSYRANNSGELTVAYTEITGDLSLFNKNDNISLTLPGTLEFAFEATTKNGTVTTDFQDSLTMEGHTTRGTVGNNPAATVTLETANGDIQVNLK